MTIYIFSSQIPGQEEEGTERGQAAMAPGLEQLHRVAETPRVHSPTLKACEGMLENTSIKHRAQGEGTASLTQHRQEIWSNLMKRRWRGVTSEINKSRFKMS